MFNIKNWGGAMLGLCVTYIIILALTMGFYFAFAPKNEPIASDIVNILLCASTLLGPIILVFTLSAWKEQHNKGVDRDMALKSWMILDECYNSLLEIDVFLTHLFDLELIFIKEDDIQKHDNLTSKARKTSAEFIQYLEIFDENAAIKKANEAFQEKILEILKLSFDLSLQYGEFVRSYIATKSFIKNINDSLMSEDLSKLKIQDFKELATQHEKNLSNLSYAWEQYQKRMPIFYKLDSEINNLEQIVYELKAGLKNAIRAR